MLAIIWTPVSAGLKVEVGGFPFGVVLMLVLGFAVRTEALTADSGLLSRRFALDLIAGRRVGFVLLSFLAMGTPVDGCRLEGFAPRRGRQYERRTDLP
jgi:hypothetical protein